MSSPSPNDLTRQQLDELDALLQRMLSLPLAGTEPAPPPPARIAAPPLPDLATGGSWRTDTPVSLRRAPHVVVESAEVPEPAVALRQTPARPEPAWGPDPLARYAPPMAPAPAVTPTAYQYTVEIPQSETVRGIDVPPAVAVEPEPEPMPMPEPVVTPAPFVQPAEPVATLPPLPLHHWPLFACNYILESLLTLLGPIGDLATRPSVKHLLGATGVVLMAAAGVWSARGMGWVTLPWPR